MATTKELSFADIMAMMKEKDFDETGIIIEGSHPAGEEYLSEENQALRASVAYLKRIDDISSELAAGLVAG